MGNPAKRPAQKPLKKAERKGKWRILHIESDGDFARRIEQYAQISQVDVVVCSQAEDLDFLPNPQEFDLLLLDSQISSVTATHVIHRLGTEVPVILTNRKNLPYPKDVNWQLLNIQQYFSNELSADPVWQSVMAVLRRSQNPIKNKSMKPIFIKWSLLLVSIGILIYIFF